MANGEKSSLPLPLFKKVHHRNTTQRALDVIILCLLLSLLFYRALSFKNRGFAFAWFLAFLCESCFALTWVFITNTKWTPLSYETFTERLKEQVPVAELPPVDIFVTTADAELEPPLMVVNTVLSLLAVDYPAHKLACYVSDDGCSPLTFYSLVEASKFAKLWVPFCKKFDVQVRAPFRYFLVEAAEPPSTSSWKFQQEWKKLKEEYEQLCQNIQDAVENSASFDLTGELVVFSNTERKNHPAIVKVVLENKEGLSDGIPHLIYISREKRPKHQHHYKAGAMNALIRVSGLMANAPFMLNVDCDMYVNNPEVVLQAMCLFLGSKEKDCAFVQFPQYFYDGPGGALVIFNETSAKGIVGIQGPSYQGTGTFHRRRVIYGLCPDELDHPGKLADDNELIKKFGNAKEFIQSVVDTLEGKSKGPVTNLSISLELAHQIAGCDYEYGSSWGEQIGLLYGSMNEDSLTGLVIHSRGWRSGYCSPDPGGFLGCSPSSLPDAMKQQKRWSTGLTQILLSKHNPVLGTLKGKLQFRQCLAYLLLVTWGARSVPDLCYVFLPAYCILTNSSFLPKFQEPGMCIPIVLVLIYNLYTLTDYIRAGFSIHLWWVENCMTMIMSASSTVFGVVNALLKLAGLSEVAFEVTHKVDRQASNTSSDDNDYKMMFDESPYFIPGTTIVLVHLAALATGLLGLQPRAGEGSGSVLGEYICSMYVVLCFLPVLQGMFRKGQYGIPFSTICKSAGFALVFLQLCKLIGSGN